MLCRSAFPRGRGWHLRAEDRKAALEGRCLGLPIRRIGVRAPGDPLVRRRAATGFGYCEWAGGTTSCRLDPSHSPKPPEPAAGLGCEQFVLRDDAFACARVRLTRAVPANTASAGSRQWPLLRCTAESPWTSLPDRGTFRRLLVPVVRPSRSAQSCDCLRRAAPRRGSSRPTPTCRSRTSCRRSGTPRGVLRR